MVQKYFRKAGVPQVDEDGSPLLDDTGETVTGPERDARQVFHRLAGCWTHWGREHDYFDTEEDAGAFYDATATASTIDLDYVHQAKTPSGKPLGIVHRELVQLMGGEAKTDLDLRSSPVSTLMLVGLQGSGKTTNSAKLAAWFKGQGRQPLRMRACAAATGRRARG